jgi:16S rRNA processing protein RimM
VPDRSVAGALRGAYLYVPESEAVTLPPGEFFVHQIVGLTVVTLGGEVLGTIEDVLQTGSNDVYVVRQDGPDGREVLLPATKEVVREVDLDSKTMRVELLPGLVD